MFSRLYPKGIGFGVRVFVVLLVILTVSFVRLVESAKAVGDVTLTGSAFTDTDAEDTHQASQWVVRDSGGTVYDSGADGANLTTITIPAATFTLGTTYFWKVRYQDQHLVWSDYSAESSFTYGAASTNTPTPTPTPSSTTTSSPTSTPSVSVTPTCLFGSADTDGDGEAECLPDPQNRNAIYVPEDQSDFCAGSDVTVTYYYWHSLQTGNSLSTYEEYTALHTGKPVGNWGVLDAPVHDIYFSTDGGVVYNRIAHDINPVPGSEMADLPQPLKPVAEGNRNTNIQYFKVTYTVKIPESSVSDPGKARLLVYVADNRSPDQSPLPGTLYLPSGGQDLGASFVFADANYNQYAGANISGDVMDFSNAVQSNNCSPDLVTATPVPSVTPPPPSTQCLYKFDSPKAREVMPVGTVSRIFWSLKQKSLALGSTIMAAEAASEDKKGRVLGVSTDGPFTISAFPVQGSNRMIFAAKPDFNVSKYYMWWNCNAQNGEQYSLNDLVSLCGDPQNSDVGSQVKVQGRQAAFVKSFTESKKDAKLVVFALPRYRLTNKGLTSSTLYSTSERSLKSYGDYKWAFYPSWVSGQYRTLIEDLEVADGNVVRQNFNYWLNCQGFNSTMNSIEQVRAVCGDPTVSSNRYDVRLISLSDYNQSSPRLSVVAVSKSSGETEFIASDRFEPVQPFLQSPVPHCQGCSPTVTATPSVVIDDLNSASLYFSKDGGDIYNLLAEKLNSNLYEYSFNSSEATGSAKLRVDHYDQNGNLFSTCYSDMFSVGSGGGGFLGTSNLVLVLGSLLAFLLSQLLGALSLIPLLARLFNALFSLFSAPIWNAAALGTSLPAAGWANGKHAWGIVYDTSSKKPIERALVRIFSEPGGKLRAAVRTNKNGQFGFVLPTGTYSLSAAIMGYDFPTRLIVANTDGRYANLYKGGSFKTQGDGVEKAQVNFNVPLDRVNVSTFDIIELRTIATISRFFQAIRFPLMILGTLSTAYLLFIDPKIINYLFAGLYVLMWGIEIRHALKKRAYGLVKDQEGNPVSLVMVRVLDRRNHLKTTIVTGDDGKFQANLDPGEYKLDISRPGYKSVRTELFRISNVQDLGNLNLRLSKL